MDSISLSATNAAGGTRVIGVGCRYYTTLRRGVFILQLRWPCHLNGRTYVSYAVLCHRCKIKGLLCRLCKISWGLHYPYRLLYKCLAVCSVPFVAIFVGRCILCEVTLFSGGGTTSLPCSNRGALYNAVFIRSNKIHTAPYILRWPKNKTAFTTLAK